MSHYFPLFSLFILSCSRACSPTLLVTVHLTHSNLKASYPKLAEHFSVSVPFTQLEHAEECEAQQENVIDRNMELCLKLTETPIEEPPNEKEQCLCVCEESPSDDTLQSQQSTCVQSDASSQSKVTLEHCANQHVEQEQESSEETPSLTDPRIHPSAEKGKKGSAAVASAVSVAQLVMEEDSLLSEVESSGSQQCLSPLRVRSNGDDPLSSLSVSSTPVRKYRRPAPRR